MPQDIRLADVLGTELPAQSLRVPSDKSGSIQPYFKGQL
jgi:hypothetical protein